MTPVIFDNDIGIDDAMALLLLHLAPDIDLIGITTRFGNASIEDTTHNALVVKDLFNIAAPVYRGAAKPLASRLGEGYPSHVHGRNGLGDIELPPCKSKTADMNAAEALVSLTRETDNKAVIVAVGGLTNIAQAIQLDREFPSRVKQLIVMGGAFGYQQHRGNVSPVAEANIASDPEAADQVFCSELPCVIVGLDVTHEVIMTSDYFARLRRQCGDAGEFIADTHQFYVDFHYSFSGKHECPLHDSSAVAYLLAPELFDTIQQPVRVVTSGIAIGQTIHSNDTREYVSDQWDGIPRSTICTGVRAGAVLDLCINILSKNKD